MRSRSPWREEGTGCPSSSFDFIRPFRAFLVQQYRCVYKNVNTALKKKERENIYNEGELSLRNIRKEDI